MSKPLKTYTTIVSLMGSGAVLWALIQPLSDWPGLLALAGLTTVAQLTSVKLRETSRGRISVSGGVALAGMLLFGPLGGVLVYAAGGLATALTTLRGESQQRRPEGASLLRRTLFNIGMFSTSGAAAGLVYGVAGGAFGRVAAISNLLPLVAAVVTDYVVNVGLLLGAMMLQTGRSPFRIWREDYAWGAAPALFASLGGSAALALGYEFLGFIGLSVFGLPILLIRCSRWLYVRRTEQTVNTMEDTSAALEEVLSALTRSRESLEQLISAVDGAETSVGMSQLAEQATDVHDCLAVEDDRLEILRDDIAHASRS